jgi:hypothetical protein
MSPFNSFCGWTSSLPDVFFFFTSSLPHLPPPSYPPSYLPNPTYHLPPLPTYHLRTPPPLTPSPELDLWSGSSSCGVVAVELWSRSCGVGAGARAPTKPTPPRSGKMLIFYFIFVCFVWRGKQAPSSGASPELLSFGACLLQLNPAMHQAPELVRLRSLLHCSSKLRSVRACCCNATNSEACPAPELACCNAASSKAWELATLQQQAPERESLLLQRSKLRSFSGSGACLLQRSKLQSFSAPKHESLLRCSLQAASSRAWELAVATQQALELVRLRSLLVATQQASELFGSGAWELAATTKPYNAASSGASLAVEEKEEEPWTFCPILNIFNFALV